MYTLSPRCGFLVRAEESMGCVPPNSERNELAGIDSVRNDFLLRRQNYLVYFTCWQTKLERLALCKV